MTKHSFFFLHFICTANTYICDGYSIYNDKYTKMKQKNGVFFQFKQTENIMIDIYTGLSISNIEN